ncbi:hypothetical protein NDI37_23170 [Funiculus sociatus GB2-A5]|uniref:Uncharacterized protein n=1 Tax=Funiculus sociatus GB2-A5 TaxID=2933946 RepID=A0ABV0JV59_9CYAN|nr:hypothetical protein [Trichocoleus sp. FACHB-6]MBD2063797.1 hypothetical protein [Trichocoleus sp. FACHB-6]
MSSIPAKLLNKIIWEFKPQTGFISQSSVVWEDVSSCPVETPEGCNNFQTPTDNG